MNTSQRKRKRGHDETLLPHGTQPSSMGTRSVAFLIDSLAVSFIVGIAVAGLYFGFVANFDQLSERGLISSGWDVVPLVSVVGILTYLSYFLISWWQWNGQTLGKSVMGARVVQMETLAPPGLSKSILRIIGYAIWMNAWPLMLVPFFTEHKRGLHDYLASTVVVQTDTLPAWLNEETQKRKRA